MFRTIACTLILLAACDEPPAHPVVGEETSCVQTSRRVWRCDNTAGTWSCDRYGCVWLQPLPEGHPLRWLEADEKIAQGGRR